LLYILENTTIREKLIRKKYNNSLIKYFKIKKTLNLF